MAAAGGQQREWFPPGAAAAAAPSASCSSSQPQQHPQQPVLRLYNSLVDDKVPFVPSGGPGSRSISWYACGPTVYDSAHMGHARNYVTFDVLRRVLEDYFGYVITYVMNVTDVDDKIILRARRNHLLAAWRGDAEAASGGAGGAATAQAVQQVSAAVDAAVAKQAKKQQAMAGQVAAAVAGDSRLRSELEAALKGEEHKAARLAGVAADLAALTAAGAPPPSVAQLLEVAGDQLAESLDEQQGGSVTDQGIFRAHAAKYEAEFFADMDALGVRRPDVLTRVVEYLPEIISYVQGIIDNGMAYESNGSVYFDTSKFRESGHVYGKCKPASVGNATLAAESEANFETSEKRGPQDFALWKAAKPGEPAWESPWGRGRPGWHIECSAMASRLIGSCMDIHSGGEDLKFPHHDNELAQAEAYYHKDGCRQWVNYFLHSGHLEIEGLKMSKSLKNFITIREALTQFSPRQLRLMFLLAPWNRPICYGENARAEMRAREAALKNFFGNVEVALREAAARGEEACSAKWQDAEFALSAAITGAQGRVHEALCDNINTPAALDALSGLIRATNTYLASKAAVAAAGPGSSSGGSGAAAASSNGNVGSGSGPDAAAAAAGMAPAGPQPLLLRKAAAYVTRILSAFGLVQGPSDTLGLAGGEGGGSAADAAGASYLDAFAAFRDTVRGMAKAKAPPGDILAACDRVRDDTLPGLGVRLEDRPDGTAAWKLDDPAVLAAERAERQAAAAEAARRKLTNALGIKAKELEKLEKLAALPSEQEALKEKYSAFDAATGEPTHDAAGQPLEGKALDKARKDLEKARKVREPLTKRLADDPAALASLAAEVAALQQQLDAL